MRDRLNGLVLAGEKEATAGLWQQDYVDEAETLDTIGERQVLVDGAGHPVAVVEIVRVETCRFVDVGWEFACAEGEGFQSIEHWRDGHRDHYASQGIRIDDADRVVCIWFRLASQP